MSRFDTIPACDGQRDKTDGQTDVQPIAITCAVRLMHVNDLKVPPSECYCNAIIPQTISKTFTSINVKQNPSNGGHKF